MTASIEIEYKEPIEIEVRVYDVCVDGISIDDFALELDEDGDLRVELEEDSFEEAAIKYLRERNDDEQLKEMFGIKEEEVND